MFRTQFAMCSPPWSSSETQRNITTKNRSRISKTGIGQNGTPCNLTIIAIWIHLGSSLCCSTFGPRKNTKNQQTNGDTMYFSIFLGLPATGVKPVSSVLGFAAPLPSASALRAVLAPLVTGSVTGTVKNGQKITMFGSIQDIKGPDNPNWGNFFQ